MKRRNIIFSLCGLWLCLMIVIAFCVNYYIDKKRNKLHHELRQNPDSLFEGQSSGGTFVTNDDGFFDEAFSGYPVRHYKKIAIPPKPIRRDAEIKEFMTNKLNLDERELAKIYEKEYDDWKKAYGDLSSLYELKGDTYPNATDEGWNIIRIHYGGLDNDIIRTNVIFPYKVGFKKSEWGNYYTVEQAVNEAFEFYTTNAKSGFANRYQKGYIGYIWSKIYDCENEYYSIVRNTNDEEFNVLGTPICNTQGRLKDIPYENGWMHNGFYRIFIAATQEMHYMIQENKTAIASDRKRLLILWCTGITMLLMMFIVPLTRKEWKTNNIKNETLYQRLLRLCNPGNYIKDYDKDKIDKANEIYQELLNMDPDDQESLFKIQSTAMRELDISLIDKEELDELKRKVNPQNFMHPYDAEKITLANELYSILSKKKLGYMEMMEVKEKLKDLYCPLKDEP